LESSKNNGIGIVEFERIFKEYFRRLVYFSFNMLKDKEAAKDIVHDTFASMWEKRATISTDRNIKSYLFTTVYNRSLNYIRNNKKFATEETLESLIENNPSPEIMMENAEKNDRINRAIESLPLKTKEVFIMSRFGEFKYKEISEKLGISVKTVEGQMSRALRMLKDNLSDIKEMVVLCIFFLIQ